VNFLEVGKSLPPETAPWRAYSTIDCRFHPGSCLAGGREGEAWQGEQALRDAAEEHLWQIVSLTVVPGENP
jgi:hypothetical protein